MRRDIFSIFPASKKEKRALDIVSPSLFMDTVEPIRLVIKRQQEQKDELDEAAYCKRQNKTNVYC